jgi:serine/threonine protein kinase
MAVNIEELPEEAKKALEQFKEFQIAEFKDSGANGYVMLGRHNKLRKDVAIKIYFHAEDEIDQEPAIIATLNHANVLKVFDARKVDKRCSFYMMQAANDGDLFGFLGRYNLSLHLSHRLLCQLLSGLAAIHCGEKKLVHRDLKPENLLVHNDALVIADFGSVRQIDEATGQAQASKHSILYRPPEAFGDEAFFDFSSDVYQAGIIGYLLFGGTLDNDLLTHLSRKELTEFNKVKITGDNYETSVFIDSCIERRVKSGRLLNWDSIPFYVPRKVKRVLRAAVSDCEVRYQNVRADLPSWMVCENGYELRNWKSNDYLLLENKERVIMKKKKHKSNNAFRGDNSIKANSFPEAYELLKKDLGLP